eukprot:15446407-Alexandrium_andersonii.AAC.1
MECFWGGPQNPPALAVTMGRLTIVETALVAISLLTKDVFVVDGCSRRARSALARPFCQAGLYRRGAGTIWGFSRPC